MENMLPSPTEYAIQYVRLTLTLFVQAKPQMSHYWTASMNGIVQPKGAPM